MTDWVEAEADVEMKTKTCESFRQMLQKKPDHFLVVRFCRFQRLKKRIIVESGGMSKQPSITTFHLGINCRLLQLPNASCHI